MIYLLVGSHVIIKVASMKGGSGSSGRVKDSRASWLFLGVTGCVLGYAGGLFDTVGIFVVVFVEYFNETNAKIGWVGSLMFFLLCFSYPFAVSLYHRFGFRAMAITSAILVTFSYLTTPLVPSANYLFLTYCIPQGIGCGFMDCLSLTMLPEFFDKYVGLATGIRLACVATGSMIFNYILPIIVEGIGWKTMFYYFSSAGVVLLFYAYFYKAAPTIQTPTYHEVIVPKESDIQAINDAGQRIGFLKDRGFQLIVIGCVPYLFAVGVPLMFMVQYAKSLGYPLSQCKWLAVVRSLASLIGRVSAGLFGDFASRRKRIAHLASTVAMVFGLASGLCSLTQHLPLMISYMAVIGFLEGTFWVILQLMMYELTGGVNADYAFSFITLVTALGFLTGPSSMGMVFDVTGDFRNVLYIICVCDLVASVLMALGIYIRSRCPNESESQPTKDNTYLCNHSKDTQHEVVLVCEKKAIAQYVSAV